LKKNLKNKKAIKLFPTLDACVETQAKQLHKQTTSALMKTPDNLQLQEQMETLQFFLEQADFKKLRAESEPLIIKGKKVTFTVWRERNKAKWEMKASP
jgi:hypothetical protein